MGSRINMYSGLGISLAFSPIFITIPRPINISTAGTPDFFAYKSKKYEIIITTAKRMI